MGKLGNRKEWELKVDRKGIGMKVLFTFIFIFSLLIFVNFGISIVSASSHEPICATNKPVYDLKTGQSLGNECDANREGYLKEDYSFTKPVIACTNVYAPVCGNDGKTYSNSCLAKGSGISISYVGECDGVIEVDICPIPFCSQPPEGCKYVSSDELNADGCPLKPCGELWCPDDPEKDVCTPEQINNGCSEKERFSLINFFTRNSEKYCDCSSAGIDPVCGNGIVEKGERCDAGSQNGILCDLSYGGECSYCSLDCNEKSIEGPSCGDGNVDYEFGEECEPGFFSGTCGNDCKLKEGGDGERESCEGDGGTYTCSPGAFGFGSSCTCNFAICGDGNIDINLGEQCDDGNIVDSDGCSADCQRESLECGAGETCVAGNTCGQYGVSTGEECGFGAGNVCCLIEDTQCTDAEIALGGYDLGLCADVGPNANGVYTSEGFCTTSCYLPDPVCGDGKCQKILGESVDSCSLDCKVVADVEICDDGIDNDGDKLVDLDDGDCVIVCPAVEDPVCGVDGNNYSNECLAGKAGVDVDYVGACIDLGDDNYKCTPEEIAAGCEEEDKDVGDIPQECGENYVPQEICTDLPVPGECTYPISVGEAFGTESVSTTGQKKVADCKIVDCNDNVISEYEEFESCVVDPGVCPAFLCAPLDDGCYYENGATDVNGCQTSCGNLVCDSLECGGEICAPGTVCNPSSDICEAVDSECNLGDVVTVQCADVDETVINSEICDSEGNWKETGDECPMECNALSYDYTCSDGSVILVDICNGEESNCSVCADGETQTTTCGDGITTIISECVDGDWNAPDVECSAECSSGEVETLECADESEITSRTCVNDVWESTGNECPVSCVVDEKRACDDGSEIIVRECVNSILGDETGNVCPVSCNGDEIKTCSDGKKITLGVCTNGILEFIENPEACVVKMDKTPETGGKNKGSGLTGFVFYDGGGNAVASIDKDSWDDDGEFDVDFVQGGRDYPESCYNAILDSGEENIDCGGNCQNCKVEKGLVFSKNISSVVMSIILIWFGLIVSILFAIFNLYRHWHLFRFRSPETVEVVPKEKVIFSLKHQLR